MALTGGLGPLARRGDIQGDPRGAAGLEDGPSITVWTKWWRNRAEALIADADADPPLLARHTRTGWASTPRVLELRLAGSQRGFTPPRGGPRRPAFAGWGHLLWSQCAMCSATIIVGRFVVAVGIVGMMDASATVRASIP